MSELTNEQKREEIEARYARSSQSYPEVKAVEAGEAKEMLGRDGVVFLDVRSPEEQQVSMIPGALTVPEFEAKAEALQGATIVSY